MKLTLTRAQLLEQWRLRAFPEPMNTDGAVSAIDGIDMDAWLEAAATDWYANLLRSAPVELLNPRDYAAELVPYRQGGTLCMRLPESTVRVVALRLSGWQTDALVCRDATDATAVRQQSPLTRAGAEAPVAVWLPGEQSVALYPDPGGDEMPVFEKALLVVDVPDVFRLDSAALAEIKNIL